MTNASDPNAVAAELERAAALKHDLGKYVAWQSANFDDEAWDGPLGDALLDALRSDLLSTRTRGDVASAAWEVWQSHTKDLARPLTQPELLRCEQAVQVLARSGDALRQRDREAVAAARPAIRQAQAEIRAALRDLHRRLLAAD